MSASNVEQSDQDNIAWRPDYPAIHQQLAPVYQALANWRAAQEIEKRSTYRNAFIALVVAALIALACQFSPDSASVSFFVILIGFIGILIYLIAKLSGQRAAYRQLYKTEIFRRVVEVIAPTMVYHPGKCVEQSFFEESELHRSRIDRYQGEDYFVGKVGKTSLLFSELDVERKETSTDSKGQRTTRWVNVFRGIFMVLDFHKEFHGKTLIQTDVAESAFGWLGRKIQNIGGGLVQLENPAFEKAFKVTSTDQVEARYILTPKMQERMLELRDDWNERIQFAFHRSLLFISLPTSQKWFELHTESTTDHDAEVKHFAAQLLSLLNIVNSLDQNTRLWTKS